MGFTINTNLDALSAYQNLSNTQSTLSKTLQQLSSGSRINNAGDDAAGMTIATDLGAQVSGLTRASQNAADGTSVVQTADGALTQAQTLLGQLRDLAVQAANDSNSTSARAALATQASAIVAQISQIGSSTSFNGIKLTDGSASTLNFQVGADGNAASQISVNLGTQSNLVTLAGQLSTVSSNGFSLTTANAATKLAAGAITYTSTLASGGTSTATVNVSSNLPASPTAAQEAAALNANQNFSAKFNAVVTYDANGNATGIGVTSKDGGAVTATDASSNAITSAGATFGTLDFSSASGAQNAITSIQSALDNVSAARANIGALENRFTAVTSAISTSITNLTAAKSRITDTDMASAMVTYSKENILAQAGTAMLSQANSLPQLALKLLQS